MRKIKFRFKLEDKITKEIITTYAELYNPKYSSDLMQYPINLTEFNVLSIDEYSGFKDANNKEIYENDILEKDLYWNIRIEYDEGSFMVRDLDKVRYANLCLNWYIGGFNLNGWKIIGDIHSNPELLEDN